MLRWSPRFQPTTAARILGAFNEGVISGIVPTAALASDALPPQLNRYAGKRRQRTILHALIEAEVRVALNEDLGRAATGMRVLVDGSCVTLSGTVGTRAQAERAESIAAAVEGIATVRNLLKVSGDSESASRRGTTAVAAEVGQDVNDALRASLSKAGPITAPGWNPNNEEFSAPSSRDTSLTEQPDPREDEVHTHPVRADKGAVRRAPARNGSNRNVVLTREGFRDSSPVGSGSSASTPSSRGTSLSRPSPSP
ncbi:MAG: BON domain-containing protein [Acidobacteria bacterium]|nr:BON domain-containing protein [Acidobacteriota bacterium]